MTIRCLISTNNGGFTQQSKAIGRSYVIWDQVITAVVCFSSSNEIFYAAGAMIDIDNDSHVNLILISARYRFWGSIFFEKL